MVSTHPTAYNRRGTSQQHSFCAALPQSRGFSFFQLKSETQGDRHCAVQDKASLRSYLQHASLRCENLETADFEDSHKDARASAPSRQGNAGAARPTPGIDCAEGGGARRRKCLQPANLPCRPRTPSRWLGARFPAAPGSVNPSRVIPCFRNIEARPLCK